MSFPRRICCARDDGYRLGWNIAAGAISDIFACGGSPLYYAHALTVSPEWDLGFLERLSDGVRDVLAAADARFIGGDCGRSRTWRCTVSVLGESLGQTVRRRGARCGDRVYLTGRVGAGNLAQPLQTQAVLQNNKFSGPDNLSLPITTTSGLFQGSVLNPSTGKPITLNGVVIQKLNQAYGCFLGTNQSGSVFLGH